MFCMKKCWTKYNKGLTERFRLGWDLPAGCAGWGGGNHFWPQNSIPGTSPATRVGWGWGLGLIPVIPGWGTEIQLAARTNKKTNHPPAHPPPALPTLLRTEPPPRAQQALFFVFLSTALSLRGQLPEWPLDTQFGLPTLLLVYSLLPQVWRLPGDIPVPQSALEISKYPTLPCPL